MQNMELKNLWMNATSKHIRTDISIANPIARKYSFCNNLIHLPAFHLQKLHPYKTFEAYLNSAISLHLKSGTGRGT